MTKRVLVLTAALATAAASLTSGVAHAQTASKIAESGKATAAANTMRTEFVSNMEMTVQGKKIKGAMTGKGMLDRKNQASSIELDLSSFMKAVMGAAGGGTLPPQFNDPANFKMKVISQGKKIWMSYPLLTSMGGGAAAKPWVLLDAAELGISAKELAASQGADPTQGLELLQGLAANAKTVGTEQVKGVETTHYRGTIELSALTKNIPANQQASVKQVFGTKPSIPVDVWIDKENRARRMDVTVISNAQGMAMTLNSQYFFSNFGEPVSITPPPASQVSSAKDNPLLAAALTQSIKKK